MKTFLLVALGVVVGLYVAVRLIWWWLKRRFKSLMQEIGAGLGGLAQAEPARITLRRRDERKPGDTEAWERWIGGLRGAGFVSAGTFAAEEMESILIHGMANPRDRALAAVYWMEGKGVWADVVSRGASGTTMTHTTAPETGLDRPEFAPGERVADADAAGLVRAHLEGRGPGPFLEATPEGFKDAFEAEYARMMDWRMARGVTEQEVRRLMALNGQEASNEAVAMMLEVLKGKYSGQLEELLREKFLSESRIAAAEWEKIEHRVIFVRDNSTVEELLGELSGRMGWDDGDDEGHHPERARAEGVLSAMPPREGFRKVVTPMSGDRAFRPLGVVRGPVTADVYVAPEYPDDPDDDEDYD